MPLLLSIGYGDESGNDAEGSGWLAISSTSVFYLQVSVFGGVSQDTKKKLLPLIISRRCWLSVSSAAFSSGDIVIFVVVASFVSCLPFDVDVVLESEVCKREVMCVWKFKDMTQHSCKHCQDTMTYVAEIGSGETSNGAPGSKLVSRMELRFLQPIMKEEENHLLLISAFVLPVQCGCNPLLSDLSNLIS